jgi:hypothetical protein
MKNLAVTLRRAALVLALLLGGFVAPADAACLSDRETRQAVRSGQAVRLNVALQQAGVRRGDVVGVKLCEGGGGYVYRVKLLTNDGSSTEISIPAS